MTDRAQAYQNRLIARGLCPHCRKPTKFNIRTRKNYIFCYAERKRRAKVARVRREAKKQMKGKV